MFRPLQIAGTCLLLLGTTASSHVGAQNSSTTTTERKANSTKTKPTTPNPHTSPSDVNQGRNFFRVYCARSHGLNARAAKRPDLTDGVFRHARNDDDLFKVITNGIPPHTARRRGCITRWRLTSLRPNYLVEEAEYVPGRLFLGDFGIPNEYEEFPKSEYVSAVRALDALTGKRIWQYKVQTKAMSGLISTAGNLVFGGALFGSFFRTQREDW